MLLPAALFLSLITELHGARPASLGVRQTERDRTERGTLRLHYVQKPIGYERYELVRTATA